MPYKEKEISKKYYNIGEVAKKINVKTSLIRFWENEFETLNPKKNKKGLRKYTCLLYTSPSPRDQRGSRMPSSA